MDDVRRQTEFHRPPRSHPPPVPEEQVVVVAPPQKTPGGKQSLMYALFPVVGSMGIFAFAIVYDNRIFLYVACAMVAITLLFALGIRWAQKRSGKKDARRQRRLYREYLRETDEKLEEQAAAQRATAAALYPAPERLWSVALKRNRLWERRPGDDDFLTVRAGLGPVEHAGRPRVDFGHNPLAEYEQKLVDEANEVVERWQSLDEQPVTVPLEAPVVSLVGPRERSRAVARAMVAQLAISRAPGELRLAAAYGPDESAQWEWLKWLPHVRDHVDSEEELAPPALALAESPAELAVLLEERITPRLAQLGKLSALGTAEQRQLNAPHLILIIDGLDPTDPEARLPLLRETMRRAEALRVSVLCLVESADKEPSDTAVRVRLGDRGGASVEETKRGGRVSQGVALDELPVGAGETFARALAPIRLVDDEEATAGVRAEGFMDLHGIRSMEEINPAADWSGLPRELALRATVGVTAGGEPLVLDLKQQAEGGMGPHGLIIGATGSGKSELLRTLVASLALTHSPEDLAFVFVDYKGGQALAELESLPHTAGMITNLEGDLNMVDRMHDALFGEQKRREQILRDAGNVDDVVAYRKLRARDPSLPPLPDLLVIIDEFSELLAAEPEMIDLFVAIGRVGRSLGIHLLFTSQRFEEGRLRGLESNLRYRICLRTYSPAESKGVIGTPDAYALPADPGVGYLRVDADSLIRFRGALVTRPHKEPEDPATKRPRIARFAPSLVRDWGRRARAGVGHGGQTEMKLLVERLAAATRGEKVHQVWLPPLEERRPLDSLPLGPPWWETGDADVPPLRATIGMLDLPREQRVEPLGLDLAGATGHMAVVGAPQSGKSSLLRTLALSLACRYRPDEVQLYCVDLGGGMLDAIKDLPHVGAVAGKGDRELIRLIIGRAKAEIEARQAAFRRLGFDSMAAARAHTGEDSFADLFLFIDGWAQLRRDFEDLDFEVEEIASAGLTYGVHVVITAQRWGEMRPSVSDNLGTRLELRLNDPLESAVGRRHAERLPADVPGRGLIGDGVEFQAALPRLDGDASGEDLGDATTAAAKAIAGRWTGHPAPPVRLMPLRVPVADLPPARPDGVVIGVDEALDPVAVDLSGADPHFLILGDGESGRTNLLRTMAQSLAQGNPPERAKLVVIDPRRTLGDLAELPHTAAYASSPPSVSDAAGKLAALAAERLPADGAAPNGTGAGGDPERPEIYLLIDDYDLLAGPESNPLAALATMLAHGRDAGLHVILARRVAGSTRASFEPFFQRMMELRTPGLLLSGDRSEGPIIDSHRAEARPPGRGLLVRRGLQPVVVQTALSSPTDAVAVAGGGSR